MKNEKMKRLEEMIREELIEEFVSNIQRFGT